MSKLDAQRAMREAKYARDSASGPTRREAAAVAAGGTAATPAPAAPSTKPAPVAATAPVAAPAAGGLCGHKSMNGRACTREAGHPEKNHRYG
jgi:hypothetical protein